MRSILKVLALLFVIFFLAEDSLYAEQVFTEGDLRKYGGESSDSTSGSDSNGNGQGSSDIQEEAIQLCTNAISSGITVYGQYSGVKSVEFKELKPSTNVEDLLYIINFDAHLETDIISPVECWVYKKKDGELFYRIMSKE